MVDADGSDSFDPRTWRRDAALASPASASVRSPFPPAAPIQSPTTVFRPGWLVPAAGSALVLAIGAAAALAMREPAAPKAAAAAPDVVAAAAPVANASRRTLIVSSPEEVAPAIAASGVAGDAVAAVNRAVLAALGTTPGEVRIEYDLIDEAEGQRLTRLVAARQDGSGVILTAAADGGYVAEVQQAQLTTEIKVVRGEMDATSFYNAAVNAGVTDSLVSAFAAAFSFDFDFQREVKPGDIFEAAFEQKVNAQGQAVGAPVLIYASLSTAEKSRALYRFLAPGETEAGWFDGNGRSVVKALMRTPIDGARISSNFGFRIHPVLGYQKLHKGTDFAAPTGTPIYASGNAVVEWAAMKGANGNLTILRHDNGWQTYYLHQSRFMDGIVPGARVRQGQEIGEVGTTGRSTGPHLHYEVHVDGAPVDPMSLDVGTAKTLAGAAMAAFHKERDRIDTSRSRSTGG